MKPVCLLFSFCLVCLAPSYQQPSEIDEFTAIGFEVKGGVKRFFGDLSNSDVKELQYHANLKVSLYAAWILCKRNCENVETEQNRQLLKHEFVGFLSGKLNVPIPNWWSTAIFKYKIRDGIQLPTPFDHPDFTESEGVFHNQKVKISEFSDTRISGTQVESGQEFTLEWNRKQSFLVEEGPVFFAICNAPNNRKVFSFSDHVGSDYDVFCVDESGKEIWHSTVSSTTHRDVGGRLGFWNGFTEIVIIGDRVLVFGVNELNVYIHSFSLSSGETLFRITTLL